MTPTIHKAPTAPGAYLATANLDFSGQFPARSGRPADTDNFPTRDAAIAFLKQRGGGAVSTHINGDFRVVAIVEPDNSVRHLVKEAAA